MLNSTPGTFDIDYLQTGMYCCYFLERLNVKICEKRLNLQKEKIIYIQDNALAPKRMFAMTKVKELRYELFEHLPFSPGLLSFNFHLLPHYSNLLLGNLRFGVDNLMTWSRLVIISKVFHCYELFVRTCKTFFIFWYSVLATSITSSKTSKQKIVSNLLPHQFCLLPQYVLSS